MTRFALVGLACLFPGAQTIDAFWRNLIEGRDTTTLATAAEMGGDPQQFYNATRGTRDTYTWMRGGFVRDFAFDPHGFALPAADLAGLDSVFQWPLHVARAALADAGLLHDGRAPARCGLMLGNLSFPTRASNQLFTPLYRHSAEHALREVLGAPEFQLPGNDRSVDPRNALVAGEPARIAARALGLSGPTSALDAACASSLYAVELACQALASGSADVMLAGAVSAADPFFIHMGFSIFQAYPGAGDRSAPLDRSSRGLCSGEGAGMLVIKRLADAQRDGDQIYAVIEGVGLSNDGRGKHLLTPNPKGQRLAFERAYAAAQIDPTAIDYVECHATGTPVGDITELNSMEAFFGARGVRPQHGSVKSNFGHLLTAAGMASIIKVVLAMRAAQIPPTINVADPLVSQGGTFGGEQIVRSLRDWPDRGTVRRAAVSAFGFGGTNAHMVLAAHAGERAESYAPLISPAAPLAIIGVSAQIGALHDAAALGTALYTGEPQFGPPPPHRWKGIDDQPAVLAASNLAAPRAGGYIDSFAFDFLRFRHPPNPADQPIAQQLLALAATDAALRDAGLREGGNVAVLLAMGTELALHQYRARVELGPQIRAGLAQAGITLSPEEHAQLEDIAKGSVQPPALVNRYTSFIGNIMASRVAAHWDFSGPALTISAEEHSVARAVEIARHMFATSDVEAIVIGAVDLAGGPEAAIVRALLGTNGAPPADGAGAIVLRRVPDARRDGQRVYALLDDLVWAANARVPGVRLEADGAATPIDQLVGDSGVATQIAGLVAGTLAIGGRYLPPPAAGVTAQPWFASTPQAAVVTDGREHERATLHLAAATGAAPARRHPLTRTPLRLVPLVASDVDGLLTAAAQIGAALRGGTSLVEIAANGLANIAAGAAGHVLVLVGRTADEIQREIGMAHSGLAAAFAAGDEWRTPAGSCATPRPVGPQAKIAFMYPGSAVMTPDAGRDLGALFPNLHERLAQMVGDPATLMGDPRLYPRAPMHKDARDTLRRTLRTDIPTMIRAGTGLGILTTLALREELGLHPAIALGYSMGEGTMLIATGVWNDIPAAVRAFDVSPLFTSQLAGERSAARAFLGEQPDARLPDDFWAVYAVRSSDIDRVRAAVAHEPNVFLTHINAPGELIVAGLAADAARVVAALGVEAFRAPFDSVVHCPPAELVLDEMIAMHDQQTVDVPGTTFYFSAADGPLALERHTLAQTLGRGMVTPVDFPRQIAQVYAAGARVFIDVGAGGSCARWATTTLAGRPHVAVATEERNADAQTALARMTARLLAHHLQLRAGAVEQLTDVVVTAMTPGLPRAIITGGERIDETIRTAVVHPTRVPVPPAELDGRSMLRPHEIAPNPVGAQHAAPAQIVSPDEIAPHGRSLLRPHEIAPNPAGAQHAAPAQIVSPDEIAPHGRSLLRPHEEMRPNVDEAQPMIQSPHAATLRSRIAELRSIVAEIDGTAPMPMTAPVAVAPIVVIPEAAPVVAAALANPSNVVWDEAALIEFARGEIGRVFGEEYGIIDSYARRVRLPMYPYLLVSRVTQIDAERGKYRPSTITTEYDIPANAWYTVDGQAPWAISVESGQCDLFLISYIGIDFESQGERVYRLLDCTLTFLDTLPREGETLRYDIRIDSYARSGESLLFFFSYNCYIDDKLVLTMRNGCAGFFTEDELAAGKGVIDTEAELKTRRNAVPRSFAPFLRCDRTSFARADLLALSAGQPEAVFGAQYAAAGRNPSLRLPPEPMLMLDRITSIDASGGAWGLGLVIAEKDLSPDDWYFPCHFKGDEVLAGSLQAEGCGQLLQSFMLWLGMQTTTSDARFQPVYGVPQVVRCRGQVSPQQGTLVYRMEVTDIGTTPNAFVRADVDIILGGRTVVRFHDLSLQLIEKRDETRPAPRPALANLRASTPPAPKPVVSERMIREFTSGSIAECLGPEFARYDATRAPRTPNGDLQLMSRVTQFAGTRGDFSKPASLVAEFDLPHDAWYTMTHGTPDALYVALMEIGLQPCGFLSAWMNSALLLPDTDLYFRNLDGKGELLALPDLRGETIQVAVSLKSSTTIPGMIIQYFDFAVSQRGVTLYRGDSSFGYFTQESLGKQMGLDGGKRAPRWPATWADQRYDLRDAATAQRLGVGGAVGRLMLLDELLTDAQGGAHGQGQIIARRQIDPGEWFFKAHFKDDPVMPGSLGVEAIHEALRLAVSAARGAPQVFGQLTPHTHVWKYRGQIPPTAQELVIILDVRERRADAIIADASVYCDGLRIYAIRGAGVRIT